MKGFFDMLTMIEVLKAILFGVVEGITEWLPISSTGHMILLDEFVKLNVSKEFLDLFLVEIQLGAILAVVVIYWNKLIPLSTKHGLHISRRKCKMWVKSLWHLFLPVWLESSGMTCLRNIFTIIRP